VSSSISEAGTAPAKAAWAPAAQTRTSRRTPTGSGAVSTGSVARRRAGTATSRYVGSAAIPSTGPVFPHTVLHTTRTRVPSSSVTSGISPDFTSG
jgi:hypothetical protein